MAKVPDFRRGWRFLRSLVREYLDTGCDDSAASLTYTTLFAVVPVMTVAFAILKLTPQLAGVGDHVEALIFQNFVPATGEQVRHYLLEFSTQASNLTTIGILFLLVTSGMMLVTVERAFNRIWRVHRSRRFLSSLLVYWALLTLGPLLLGAGLAASSYLFSSQAMTTAVGHAAVLKPLLAVLPFVLGTIFFSIVYIAVPNCHVPVREGVIGGVVAALLMELARHAFTFFVTRFTSYELVYGAFAAVPLFLLWVYISWMITLFGVVLVYSLANWDDAEVQEATTFPALIKVLALFRARQHEGRSVSDREARHVARLSGIDNWHELRERLLAAGFIERAETGALLLACDLHKVRLADIARVLSWDVVDRLPDSGREPDAFAQAIADHLREAVAAFDTRLDEPVAVALDRLASTDS